MRCIGNNYRAQSDTIEIALNNGLMDSRTVSGILRTLCTT